MSSKIKILVIGLVIILAFEGVIAIKAINHAYELTLKFLPEQASPVSLDSSCLQNCNPVQLQPAINVGEN